MFDMTSILRTKEKAHQHTKSVLVYYDTLEWIEHHLWTLTKKFTGIYIRICICQIHLITNIHLNNYH